LKLVFWGLAALDLLGILLLFVLGLAAAGSSRTSPLQVTSVLLVLPCIPLAAAVVVFLRSSSPMDGSSRCSSWRLPRSPGFHESDRGCTASREHATSAAS
jgi:hypothetical protein